MSKSVVAILAQARISGLARRGSASLLGGLLLAGMVLGLPACRKGGDKPGKAASSAAPSASARPVTLTPEQSAQVLARIGDRTITLGDYAAALDRMDVFERMRYQSPERRRLLLNEMIELDLLAEEARRRGLDKTPETQERLRQMLRDELLRDVRRGVKSQNEFSEAEVRKYYDEHKADFQEPERRRVSHIQLASLAEAKRVLEKAKDVNAADWGKLVEQYSTDRGDKSVGAMPRELAGDLGIVGPPGHPRGSNPRVPEALRAAVFKIDPKTPVLDEVVQDGGKFHVVRMASRTEARERSYEEAQRSIRVTLIQEAVKQREADLEKELRAKYPVTVDEAALAKLHAPKPSPSSKGVPGKLPTRPLP
ncbi:MAG TPA: peptidyl-prolyl cis-trans isomerase [Polyangiaceae bacterium]|nr:peptidyl-prolyl cis-trans isomerase [Polyangiaceae bacterium]